MITIIVPIFNARQYIERCVSCLQQQTLPFSELILVDDGSTDGSGDLCEECASKDHRVRVIHQENQGASIARRVGIKAAQGDYLAFMDCDDIIEPSYLEYLMTAITQHGTAISVCDQIVRPESSNIDIGTTYISCLLSEDELYHRFFKYDFWGFPCKLYKREVFYDIYFPNATINEDYAVMSQLFARYKQVAYVPIPLYHYLTHDNSLSRQSLSLRMMDEWINKKWVYDFYSEHNPRWKRYAEAQAAETCCKLIGAITEGDKGSYYLPMKKEMQTFLRQHIWSLLFNVHILLGIKLMIFRRSF